MTPYAKALAYKAVVGIANEDHEQYQQKMKESYRVIRLEQSVAAAGQGDGYSQWTVPQKCFVRISDKSMRADRLIRVSGPSMEPKYWDGDILYVLDTEAVRPGDDVISSTSEGFVVKHFGSDRRLHSLNSEYPFRLDP